MSTRDDHPHETPPAVTGAVSIGTAPLPFLAVYAVLFIVHGTIAPAHPPAITNSQTGELIAGIIAAAIFVLLAVTLWLFLNGRYRWPFLLGQLIVLGTVIWWLTDNTTGGAVISVLIVITSLVSLVLGLAPDSWRHVGRTPPPLVAGLFRWRGGRSAGDPARLPGSGDPTMVEPSSLRHRHRPE